MSAKKAREIGDGEHERRSPIDEEEYEEYMDYLERRFRGEDEDDD